MEQNNDVIMHKKSVIINLIKDFREIIKQYGFKYKKNVLKYLRKRLRSDEKAAYDEDEDDIKCLQEIIDRLSKLKKHYIKKNKYDKNIKYLWIETIKYMFENNDKDYNLYLTNYQQYQSFSSKTLLTPNEYLKKIRPELTKLISEDCKVKLSVNAVFRSTKDSNDKRTVY